MKIYVLSNGKFVQGVSENIDILKAQAEKDMKFMKPSGYDWRPEQGTETWDFPRIQLYYKDTRTNRWNQAGKFIAGGETV